MISTFNKALFAKSGKNDCLTKHSIDKNFPQEFLLRGKFVDN